MRALTRPPEPGWLAENSPRWADLFVALRKKNPRASFQWAQLEKVSVYEKLVTALQPMSAGHCAYCDAFPLDAGSQEQIDHFLPKSIHPELSYTWSNLYLCCPHCNGAKHDQHVPDALRPDEPGYTFERFFVYDNLTGRLSPHPAATPEQQRRVERTIELFGLNEDGLPQARKRTLRQFRATLPHGRQPITDFAYVFLLACEVSFP